MAKNTATAEATADETPETNATPETETAEKKETLAARMKKLILALHAEIKDSGAVYEDTIELLNNVAGELASAHTRGIPASIQLETAQAKQNEIYARAAKVVSDTGTFAFASPEDEAMNETLTVKIRNLKKVIAKEKADKKASEKGESGPENNEQ